MAKKLTSLGKRILPLMLAVMLIASMMFVPTVVSANDETDPWAQTGLHKTTVIDFNGSTDIADYTALGTTPTIAEGTAIVDGALYIKGNNDIRFDAYGDIETLSMDIKVDSETNATVIPAIVFYDEIYTYGDEQIATATSKLEFGKNANGWRVKTKGISNTWRDITSGNNIGVDWSQNWLTVTLTYGTKYVQMNNCGCHDRVDDNGNTLYCKYLTKVTLTDANGTEVYSWTIDESTHNINCQGTSYGVNWTLTGENAVDNENVTIGFTGSSTTQVPMTVDNIKVTYRENVDKVIALIDEIGTVDASETCLAKIVKAETAYGLLSETEQAKVTNYATLTEARAAYDNIVENADVVEVEELIDAIGSVDDSDDCLAKIVAAEEAYAALASDKQAKVSNYAVLKKARNDYNAAKFGVHATTEINFNDSANIADYTALGTTPTINAYTSIVDGALYLKNPNNAIRFDAYGDIETLSMDIKTEGYSGAGSLPGIVFYDEIYTDKDGNTVTATSTMAFSVNASGVWRARIKGLSNLTDLAQTGTNWDWSSAYYTLTLTYGTEYIDNSDNGTNIRYDALGNELVCKFLTRIAVTDANDTEVFAWDITTSNSDWASSRASYGVNRTLTDAEDNENVMIGFDNQFENTYLGMYVDNITVTYRNIAKVEALIDAIGTVEATDDCLAKIVKAEGAYNLLSAEEKAAVSNADVLTAARTTYNNLVENADVYAVEALIDAIGVVELNDASLEKIVSAEEAYDALSPEKQALVSNAATLTEARATYDALVYNAPIDAVEALIDAIGTVDASDACLEKIVAAEEAYAELSEEKQALVSNAATLTEARSTYDALVYNAPVDAVEELIAAIGSVDASDACLEKIVAAEEAYAELPSEKQGLVSNYSVLVKARADYNSKKYGIHSNTVIDFNGSTNIADYTALGTTPTIADGTAIVDGALYIKGNNDIRFDAYGDIETLSMDIKVDSEANVAVTPAIVFYDEIYTYGENQVATATSKLEFGKNGNGWRVKAKGLSNNWKDITTGNDIGVDWSQNWLTATFTYGTKYIQMANCSHNNTAHDRVDDNNNILYCKYLTKVALTDANGEDVYSWEITESSCNNSSQGTTYGVNWTLTGENVSDNENVTIGFANSSTTQVGMSVDNITVTYRNDAAVNAVASAKDITTVDNSAEFAQKIELLEETYNVLPADKQDSEAKAAIDALKAKVEIAAAAEAPVVEGATIRTTDITSDQNIRYTTTMPTSAIDGYSIVEFGTVMFPAQYLGDKELTLNSTYTLSNGSIATVLTAKGNAADYEEIPAAFDAELYGIDFSETANACGIRISARSYVKYSDGTTTFIIYSENDKTPNTEATEGVKNGTCTRSVYSIAKTMAKSLLDTTTYPTDTFGEIVGSIDLATNTNAEILSFVYNNIARLGAIAAVR